MSDSTLLNNLNSYCLAIEHEHRKAISKEYSLIERNYFTNNGCYLCKNQLLYNYQLNNKVDFEIQYFENRDYVEFHLYTRRLHHTSLGTNHY